MVRTCMYTFKVTSIEYTGTNPKGFTSNTGPAPGTYVLYYRPFSHNTDTPYNQNCSCYGRQTNLRKWQKS